MVESRSDPEERPGNDKVGDWNRLLVPVANLWETRTKSKHKLSAPRLRFIDSENKTNRTLKDFGPGGGLGIGCGAGIGVGVTGGVGIGASPWNYLKVVFGIGIGCGVGIGFGYGQGIGIRWDRRPEKSHRGKRIVIEI